jgi:hypothetical protein
MKKKKIKIYFYKCDVMECENKVYSPGSVCSECLEKMSNDLLSLNYCIFCHRIINFIDQDLNGSTNVQKIIASVCKYCDDSNSIFPF